MTVTSTINRCSYAGNGSTKAFAVPFLFIADADVQVVLRNQDDNEVILEPGVDYGLSGSGNAYGGVLTLAEAPGSGQTLVVRRIPSIVQEVDYMENGPFAAETHERALDRLTMICQSLSERLDRAVSLRVSSAVKNVTMPDPQDGRALIWRGNGNLDNGPRGEDIASAQHYAETAVAAAEDAACTMETSESVRADIQEMLAAASLPDIHEINGGNMLRVIDDASGYELRSAAEVRSDIGAVTTCESNGWAAAQRYETVELTIEEGNVVWDVRANPNAVLRLTEDAVLTLANVEAGASYELTVMQGDIGGRIIAWPSDILWAKGEVPVISGASGAEDVIMFTARPGGIRAFAVQNMQAVAS